jgi:hypothetical protein
LFDIARETSASIDLKENRMSEAKMTFAGRDLAKSAEVSTAADRRLQPRLSTKSPQSDTTRSIVYALGANIAIAIAKFVVALLPWNLGLLDFDNSSVFKRAHVRYADV